jgi:hypothetical protein
VEGILWNRKIPEQCRTAVCEVFFKLILTYNDENGTHTERNKNLNIGHEIFLDVLGGGGGVRG